jgi:hypothetical protein
MVRECGVGSYVAGQGLVTGYGEHKNNFRVSYKAGKFLDWLSDY